MSAKTLFSIILKVIGLYFLRDVFQGIIGLIPYAFNFHMDRRVLGALFDLGMAILAIALYAVPCYLFLFKTEGMVRMLGLDKTFSENVALNFDRSVVLNIAVFLIAGFTIIQELPHFVRQLYGLSEMRQAQYDRGETIQYGGIIESGSHLMLGILLLLVRRPLVEALQKKSASGPTA